jgi:hypothetical protein
MEGNGEDAAAVVAYERGTCSIDVAVVDPKLLL